MTIQAGKSSDATTRALELDGSKLVAKWANGDVVYLAVPTQTQIAAATGTSTDALGAATITFTASDGTNTYTAGKTGYTFAAAKYYSTTLAMETVEPTLANTMSYAGMTVKVNFNYGSINYCLFVSNGDGTYTFQNGEGYAGGYGGSAKALVVENGKLVFKQNDYKPIDNQWDDFGFQVTFDTSNNSYVQWAGSSAKDALSSSFTSVEVNGTVIALAKIITVEDLVLSEGQEWSTIITNNSDKIYANDDFVVCRLSDNAKLLMKNREDWEEVNAFYRYESQFVSYKFEGD